MSPRPKEMKSSVASSASNDDSSECVTKNDKASPENTENRSPASITKHKSEYDQNLPVTEIKDASPAYKSSTDTNSSSFGEKDKQTRDKEQRSTPPKSTTPPQQQLRNPNNHYGSSSTLFTGTQEAFVSPESGSIGGFDNYYASIGLPPSLLSPQPHMGGMMQPTQPIYAGNGSYLSSPFSNMGNGQGSEMMSAASNTTLQPGSPYGYGGYAYFDPANMECQWPNENRLPYLPPMHQGYGQSVHLNPRRPRMDDTLINQVASKDGSSRQQMYDQHFHAFHSGGPDYYGYGNGNGFPSNNLPNKGNDHQPYFTPFGQVIYSPGPPIQLSNANKGPDGANLFIFHIPNQFTNLDMYHLFQPFGNLISVRIMVERGSGRSRGFGFVSYDNPESAVIAIKKLNGYQIGNKRLKVQHKQAISSNDDPKEWSTDDSHTSQTSESMSPATSPSQSSAKVKVPSEGSMDMDPLWKALPKTVKGK